MSSPEEILKASKLKGTETLPPAGHGRREALVRRQVALEQEIEERASISFLHAIDPAKFGHIDNEIAQLALDGSDVPNARDDYCYSWIEWNERSPSDHGQHLMRAQGVGYEFVHAADPDAKGMDKSRTTPDERVRWGTAVLMRIPRTRYIHLKVAALTRQKIIEGQHMNAKTLVEMGERYNVNVLTHLPAETMSRARMLYDIQKRQSAMGRIDKQLRTGLPGHFSS